jgi:signal transduction histidine kinase
MFRRRLTVVLLLLAASVVLQGVAAVFALQEAERQVVRGRMASDILQRFVELSATKQRLRSWVTQYNIGAGGQSLERDALERRMRVLLQELQELTVTSADLGGGPLGLADHEARLDALAVLKQSMDTLSVALLQTRPLSPQTQAREAWDALAEVFEQSEGRELRPLISQSIAREQAAMQRERAAADASLSRMRTLWIGMALALALAALGATLYFARALRRPLDALVSGAQNLQQGQLQHRIELHGRDEFAAVARSMNEMAQALAQHQQREAQQRQWLEATVTERTEDLHRANESLRRTDVRRRQLLADISHELRTPTTVILGEAEVTLRQPDPAASVWREALHRIADTSRQLGAVIDDLLAMARSDLETLSLAREPVLLAQPLLEALSQAAALAAHNQVSLVSEGGLPEQARVFADPQRLKQLVLLLLDNAIRYSHPGAVVQWRVRTDANWAQVCITDHGIGIARKELAHVFERHFRGAGARRHRASGSGLGLPIAQSLALAHGGTIHIISPASPSGGTRVTLRLPLLLAHPTPDTVLETLPEQAPDQALRS